MTDQQILKQARAVLPLLDGLLGVAAPDVKQELERLLAEVAKKGAKEIAAKILELLTGYPAVRNWLRKSGGTPASTKKGFGRAMPPPPPTAPPPPDTVRVSVPFGIARVIETPVSVQRGGGTGPRATPPEKRPYQTVSVHFATDRRASGKTKPADFFTGQRAPRGTVTYGTCDVSIPADHVKSMLENPSWKKGEFRQDPKKHVVLMSVSPLDRAAFFASASQGGPQALVFVHGYNVTFEDGARRMAQIAYDLPFVGVPILYSWPSRGEAAAYTVDESTIDWTVPHLLRFLEDLAQTGIEKVHIIAHSMGNRAVARALQLLALKGGSTSKFHQVVLTAPDIDAEVFEQMAAEVLNTANRVTLYASSEDKALIASKTFHGYPRAGDAAGGVVVVQGMDSVDATGVDTSFLKHSYAASDRTVLTDVYYVLRGDAAADRKATIRKDGAYYRFVL
ncbi:MAG: alpha/beta fold hydrolase [Candidatus Solibacter sp.]|nr:alpha/beta fold hydrolase [Candidatus Solibacter sp.]